MELKIKTFGVTRDILGASSYQAAFENSITANDLLEKLKVDFPALVELNSIVLAVNANYVDGNTVIKEGDEIALIPPVSGG